MCADWQKSVNFAICTYFIIITKTQQNEAHSDSAVL